MTSLPLFLLGFQLLPLVGFLGLFILPQGKIQGSWLVLVQGLLLLLTTLSLVVLDKAAPFQTYLSWVWYPQFGLMYSLGIDGFSQLMVSLTALLFFCHFVLLLRNLPAKKVLQALLLLETFLIGLFTSSDLLVFYVYWELVMLPILFLFFIQQTNTKIGLYLFFFTLAGSLAMLAGIILLVSIFSTTNVLSFNFQALQALKGQELPAYSLIWGLILLAFLIKTPMFGLHAWQRAAYKNAPKTLGPIFAALVSKMGIYGIYRVLFSILGPPPAALSQFLLVFAVLGVIYGAWLAVSQKDSISVFAYSSLSHLNLILFGLFVGSELSIAGALFFTIQHSIIVFGLFWIFLAMEQGNKGTESKEILLFKDYPYIAAIALLFALANVGLPGLSGFVGEFSVLFGSFASHPYLTSFASLIVILSAVYTFLWLKAYVYEQQKLYRHYFWTEKWVYSFLVMLLIYFGLFPMHLFSLFPLN